MLALAGLLALARFAVAIAAWDVGNGFSLMGASRDLTISVFVEATLVLAVAVPALIARHDRPARDDRRDGRARTSGRAPRSRWRRSRFAVVVVAETGRQPVDNPDTHLELTMIHEGPLLEYAGRDLAYLQWAAAARHWLVLVLAREVLLPHPASPWWQLAALPAVLVGSLRRAGARWRRSSRRCASCSCRGCSASAGRSRCSASLAWLAGTP